MRRWLPLSPSVTKHCFLCVLVLIALACGERSSTEEVRSGASGDGDAGGPDAGGQAGDGDGDGDVDPGDGDGDSDPGDGDGDGDPGDGDGDAWGTPDAATLDA